MITVVIPTLNEERALPATLESLLAQDGTFEALVVDGGSDDGTRRVVLERKAACPGVQWMNAERGRARQMNAAAGRAKGEWLLFLHADTLLPLGALLAIEALRSGCRAGCFQQRFSGDSRLLRALSWSHNRRFCFTQVIYGDQAMFIRRALFFELGGFPDRQMEDIAFSLKLRAVTRPVMLPLTVTTDARKFDQIGHWQALGQAIALLIRFRFGADVESDPFFEGYR